jgi:hypothetical protein
MGLVRDFWNGALHSQAAPFPRIDVDSDQACRTGGGKEKRPIVFFRNVAMLVISALLVLLSLLEAIRKVAC